MTRERTSPPSSRGARAPRSAPPVAFEPELPKAARPARPALTPDEGLDVVSEQLALVLERADGLLADWSSFGARVRGEVEDAATTVGDALGRAVASATVDAAQRAAAVSRDAVEAATRRSLEDHIGAQLRTVAQELAALEARARAAAHHATAMRRRERTWSLAVIAVLALANLALASAVFLRHDEPAAVAPAAVTPAAVTPAAPSEPPPSEPPAAPTQEPTSPSLGPAAPAPALVEPTTTAPASGPATTAPSGAEQPPTPPATAPSRSATSKRPSGRRTTRPAATPAEPQADPAR